MHQDGGMRVESGVGLREGLLHAGKQQGSRQAKWENHRRQDFGFSWRTSSITTHRGSAARVWPCAELLIATAHGTDRLPCLPAVVIDGRLAESLEQIGRRPHCPARGTWQWRKMAIDGNCDDGCEMVATQPYTA